MRSISLFASPVLLGIAACASLEAPAGGRDEPLVTEGRTSGERATIDRPTAEGERRKSDLRLRRPAPEAPAESPAPEAAPESVELDLVLKPEDEAVTDFLDAESGRGAGSKAGAAPAPAPARPKPTPRPEVAPPRRRSPPSSPGVKAGAADDNLQFNAFLKFSEDNRNRGLPHVVRDRVVLQVRDQRGRPVAGARVVVDGQSRRVTYADGRTLLHPQRWGVGSQADIVVEAEGVRATSNLGAARSRKLDVTLPADRGRFDGVPLDIAFILDTTGSMGDELTKLRDTLDVITFQISQMSPRPRLRLGMVLFRDKGDDYVTRTVPFTPDLARFKAALRTVRAGGGGDTPEDVQSGLRIALQELNWGGEGLRLAFLVGDAPPHLDYQQKYSYVDALEEAAQRGIKITTIGASGLDRQGELVWRQLAQATMAPFVFLTYGESGDSEGSPSTVSHHVGSNWVAADLDAIIVKMVKVELSHFSDRGFEPSTDWFSADGHPERPSEDVLKELFDRAMKQLVDYAVEPLARSTPTVLLPLSATDVGAEKSIERLSRWLSLGLARKPEFQLLEADRKADLLKALAQQMSQAYDESKVAEVGKLVPAKLAVLGQVGPGEPGRLEMLVKLVRIETGEVLSLSLLKVDRTLVL